MNTAVFVWLIIILGSLFVTPETPPVLLVTLRDAQGAPIAGAAVTIIDLSGTTVLARATIDVAGEAQFAPLPVRDARVQVTGRLADGTPLRHSAADARGILVIFDSPPTRLDLRAEPDGTVMPDPATMIAPDIGVPPAEAWPTATRALSPTTTPLSLATPTVPAATSPETTSFLRIPGLALAIILILVCGVALLALTRKEQL